MDCRVVVEAAVPVYDVETTDEAIRIAISKTGKMLNPDLSYVDIEMRPRTTQGGEELPPAFVAADEALVALDLEMTVFNVEGEEHAGRVARKEIGKRLDGIPLKILSRDEIPDDDEVDSDTDDADEGVEGRSTNENDEDDEDLLPEFEDLVEENRD